MQNLPFPEGLGGDEWGCKSKKNHFFKDKAFNPIFGTWNMPVELHQTFLLSYLRIVYQHKDNSDNMFRLEPCKTLARQVGCTLISLFYK